MRQYTIDEIKSIHRQNGGHFFDAFNMRCFSSRISEDVYPNNCFVTSERDTTPGPYKAWNGQRRYTVRQFDPETGDIKTVSEFGEFATSREAKREAPNY